MNKLPLTRIKLFSLIWSPATHLWLWKNLSRSYQSKVSVGKSGWFFPLDWVWRNSPNQTSEVTNDSEKWEGWRALVEDFTSPLFDKWFQKMRRLKRALGEDFREKSGFGGKLHRLNNQFFNNQSRKFLDFKDFAEDCLKSLIF